MFLQDVGGGRLRMEEARCWCPPLSTYLYSLQSSPSIVDATLNYCEGNIFLRGGHVRERPIACDSSHHARKTFVKRIWRLARSHFFSSFLHKYIPRIPSATFEFLLRNFERVLTCALITHERHQGKLGSSKLGSKLFWMDTTVESMKPCQWKQQSWLSFFQYHW